MTPQKKMEAALRKIGLPYSEIKCYGSQITVECGGHKTASRWSVLLSEFATVRGVVETVKENATNAGTVLNPSKHRVFRVYAQV